MAISRIWNLRRGDADDDRTSPDARSTGSLLFSIVLEFNFLKAAIGLLILIIGPALLVGIAPSLVVSFGLLKFQVATTAGRSLVSILVSLAVLIGVAVWLGRPFLASAVDHFWSLHYTLVFPIFVVLREVLRTVAERFVGKSPTPERLHRRRQIGAILAALLLAGGGLALAAAIEFSVGLQLIDVAKVQPWAVVKAALGNAAVVLGLSAAAESLYWLWHELTLSGPVLDWTPNPAQAGSANVRVAHLSDLHLVGERYGFRMEKGTHGPRGNSCIRNVLHRLDVIHAAAPLDRILVTGDVTDAGTRAEWAEFADLLRDHPELRSRLSFVPGNHDVSIVDRTNPGRLDLPWNISPALRRLRVVLALDAIQGERARVVDRDSGRLGPTLHDYLREDGRAERLQALAQRGTLRGRWEISDVWQMIFPLVEPPPENGGCGIILLDSNAPSYFSLTNAIGVVNPSQLRALKSVLRNYPGRAWLILLHHQVVEYPVTSINLRDRIGLALINAAEVLTAIAPHASRLVVLHGHRHKDWIGVCGKVVLCSAPSAALGSDKDESHGSFHIRKFATGDDGGLQLIATERVEVG